MKAGDRYERLVAIEDTGRSKSGNRIWVFRCDCGKRHECAVTSVKRGLTRSCGCLRKETATGKVTHGQSKTSEYRIWMGMKLRCEDPDVPQWKDYGGRGIRICDRWQDFENFIADMGQRPKGHSLERRDVNGNYEPGNCLWTTPREQANNRRSNRKITFEGETKNLGQWAEQYGMSLPTLKRRVDKGWPIKEALETPVRAWG